MRIIAFICTLAFVACADVVRYDGYKTIRITAHTDEQVAFLNTLKKDNELDIWNVMRGEIDVMVPPHRMPELELELNNKQFTWTTLVQDVQQLEDNVQLNDARDEYSYNYSAFNSYEDTMAELDFLKEECANHPVYSDLICVISVLDPTTENRRDIKVFRIHRETGVQRKSIYIDGLVHAREWLSGTTTMNILNDVVHGTSQYGINALENYDIFINPIANPDGYEYSRNNDRMWRKNRGSNFGSSCDGVDLNRNFDFDWGVEPGSSSEPCDEDYRGSSALSENEALALEWEMKAYGLRMLIYVSMHTYGQKWLTPYGTADSEGDCKMPNTYWDCQRTVAQFASMGTASLYGSTWMFGSMCDVEGYASGTSIDFALGSEGVTFALEAMLRGQDNSGNFYGHLAPESEIQNAFSEVWKGIASAIVEIELLESSGTCQS